jgi:hypothetical protein
MNPALCTDARLLRLLSPEAMPAQPRADWRVRGSRPYAPEPAALSLPCPCAHTQPAALCVSRRVRLAESISECDGVRGAECGGEGLVDAVLRIFQPIFVYSPQAR